jgi:hypothetical protein
MCVLGGSFQYRTKLTSVAYSLLDYKSTVAHSSRMTVYSRTFSGGPAGVIYGYIVVWFGNMSVFMVLSELVSM